MKQSLLAALVLVAGAVPAVAGDDVRGAINKGLRRLEEGSASYLKNRDCFSCHHQGVPILVFSEARKRGLPVEQAKLGQQIDFTIKSFQPKRKQIIKGNAVPGGNTMAAYALFSLEASGHGPDETTASLVQYLLVRQRPDGSWPALMPRPPSEGSSFTNAALAFRALRAYGPAKDAPGAEELREKIDKAVARGRGWLEKNDPASTEDKAFHLRGLVYAGADPDKIKAVREALVKEQRGDGSWAQLADMEGDAYATGSVLTALVCAGLEPTEGVHRRGVKFLLAKQRPDGAWLVETRSRPVQTFFDNGDPGGKSQFISFTATGWAVLALIETLPTK